LRCLFLEVNRPLDSKLLDPVGNEDLGSGGAVSLSKKLDRPIREFTVKSWDQLLRSQIEMIRNEIHAGRITGVFWTDGDQYGDITEPIFIADGNGSQTQFVMPFANVFAPSWKIWVGQALTTTWTMDEEPGVITFTSAPTGRITGLGKRKFRVVMVDNSGSILSESQLVTTSTDGAYSMEPIVLREANAVNVA
jgi:hypothetical protein